MTIAVKLAEMDAEIGNLALEIHAVAVAVDAIDRCTADARLKVQALKERAAMIHADCIAARQGLEIQ